MSKGKRFLLAFSLIVTVPLLAWALSIGKADQEIAATKASLVRKGVPLDPSAYNEVGYSTKPNGKKQIEAAIEAYKRIGLGVPQVFASEPPERQRMIADQLALAALEVNKAADTRHALWPSVHDRSLQLRELAEATSIASSFRAKQGNVTQALEFLRASETAQRFGYGDINLRSASAFEPRLSLAPFQELLALTYEQPEELKRVAEYAETAPILPSVKTYTLGEPITHLWLESSTKNIKTYNMHRYGGGSPNLLLVPSIRKAVLLKLLKAWNSVYEQMSHDETDWRSFQEAHREAVASLTNDKSVSGQIALYMFGNKDVGQYWAQMESTRLLMRVGTRIMAFWLKQGKLPETLEAAGAALVDPIEGEVFRYSRSQDGFRVYSVGLDGEDNKGSNFDLTLEVKIPPNKLRPSKPRSPSDRS
jgi:hypothetical protein